MLKKIKNINLLSKFFFYYFEKLNSFWKKLFFRFCFKNVKKLKILFEERLYLMFFKNVLVSLGFYLLEDILELNTIFHYLKNNYYTTRFFFGYPNKGRTRSNGNIANNKSTPYKNIVLKNIYYKIFIKQKQSDRLLLLYVEFFNKLWFFQWKWEWNNAKQQFDSVKHIKRGPKKWRFGYLLLTYKRPMTYTPKLSKIKANKKKRIEIKNIYNIGFDFGFAVLNKEIIKLFNYKFPASRYKKNNNKKKKCFNS